MSHKHQQLIRAIFREPISGTFIGARSSRSFITWELRWNHFLERACACVCTG